MKTSAMPWLAKACELDSDFEALHLPRAAQIVRRHIIGDAKVFNGFPTGCQQDSVPPMLLPLVTVSSTRVKA